MFNQNIVMDFLMTKIWNLFSKVSTWVIFCYIDDFFPYKMYVKKMSKWVYFHMNLISSLTNP
jgi:hypothetical protein